jgi:hypothetical protein
MMGGWVARWVKNLVSMEAMKTALVGADAIDLVALALGREVWPSLFDENIFCMRHVVGMSRSFLLRVSQVEANGDCEYQEESKE